MADVKLNDEEAGAVRAALSVLSVRARTGELGIVHGAERFVSSNLPFKNQQREALNRAAVKLGLARGIPEVS